MREHSVFDGSQAEAVVDVLTRQVALVQGPPGTGKTFAGVELVKGQSCLSDTFVDIKLRPVCSPSAEQGRTYYFDRLYQPRS